ncbi:uncharacterized protein LOC142317811 [Lycorma delicatula]|uniref:uncharacterized protein LOC142317811 n=1 Tax=Lycorma delicatula TaxID=130591 RepID=UPI003F51330F
MIMPGRNIVIFFVLVTIARGASFIETISENDVSTESQIQNFNDSFADGIKTTKLIVKKTCLQEYSSACLKLDLIKILDRLSISEPLQLLPGVTLIQKPADSPPPVNLRLQDSPRLDNYLYRRVNSYLRSLSLNVQILDDNVLKRLKTFGEGAIELFEPHNEVTARKRNKMNQAFWIAGLLSAGTMLAMGMSAMSAMAGKALMTSLLALMLSAFAALKGHNDEKKSTTYEIITRPIITHSHGHGHKHSEPLSDSHMMMGSSHTGPSYTYRRSIDHGQPQDYPFLPITSSRP